MIFSKRKHNFRRSREDRNEGKARQTKIKPLTNIKSSIEGTHYRPNSSRNMTSRSRKNLFEDSHMAAVQKRKQEIFKKRQIELQAKLQKKEAKRKILSDSKWTYTPKNANESPLKAEMVTDSRCGISEDDM